MTIGWNFSPYNYGRRKGISDSGVETFRGDRYRHLAKVICQNSLDAIKKDEETVKIDFQHIEIDKKDIPGYERYIEVFNQCYETSKIGSGKVKDFFAYSNEILAKEKISVLRISDFNTTGLTGSKEEKDTAWNDLIKAAGISNKGGEAGGSVICRELENLSYRSPRGSSKWSATTVLGIIKNEKYKGDLLMGKTFTLDPITKRRLENFGEEDKFYIKDHHEGIVSEEDFDKAQAIRLRRAKNRNAVGSKNGKRDKFSRKYAFSCLLECGFCGSNLSRRSWHSKSQYKKTIWQCVTGTKKGKKFCPNSKGIEEIAIEKAFLESYRQLTSNNKDIVNGFLELVEASLNDKSLEKNIKKLDREIAHLLNKQNSLVDLRLEEKIDSKLYEEKYLSFQKQYSEKSKEKESLEFNLKNNNEIKNRMKTFKTMLERKEVLKEFDRYVFESIVEKVIVGETDENGDVDPYKLTFVYKTGFKDDLDGERFKTPRKNASAKNKRIGKDSAELSSYTSNHVNKSYYYSSDDTYRDNRLANKKVKMEGTTGVFKFFA